MKRTLSYAHLDGCLPVYQFTDEERKSFAFPESDKSEKDSNVFDFIYAPDPITLGPQNAIGVYLNSNNPTLVDYIKRNLMVPQEGSVSSDLVDTGVISDDDLITLTRSRNETLEEYTGRVNEYMLNSRRSARSAISTFEKAKALSNDKKD